MKSHLLFNYIYIVIARSNIFSTFFRFSFIKILLIEKSTYRLIPKDGPGIFFTDNVISNEEMMLYLVGSTNYFFAKLDLVPNPKEADFLVLSSGIS